MSEIKTKKNFGGRKFDENRDVIRTRKHWDNQIVKADKSPDVEPERNTQKTTDDSDFEQRRVNSLLHVIFKICELSGFWVEERIVLKDRKTGKIWR